MVEATEKSRNEFALALPRLREMAAVTLVLTALAVGLQLKSLAIA